MPALLLHRIGDGRSEIVCDCALDRLVTKAADPIELSRLEPVEEDAEILFRLAGKADDEGRANRQLGANLAPPRDAQARPEVRQFVDWLKRELET